ncbi:MAG: hypothetical protein IKA40_00630, partial [Clostridia bacterium]|nr:hypothetical protein [Clostridia bacterium]
IVLPQTYFDIRAVFTMNGAKINFHSRNMNRFTFIFSDPNNAACAYVGILAYLVLFEKINKPTELVFTFVSAGICVVTTFSLTGALMLAALLVALLIIRYETKKTCLYVMGGLAAAVVVVVLGAWIFAGASILENEIIAAAIKRFSNQSVGTAGGRVSFWEKTINSALEWYNIVIGKGAVIDGKGVEYLPHSGHLYLLISYGLPVNIVFYLTFFKVDKKNLWNTLVVLMPLFMAFTINTGLGDYRFMTVMTLLIAYIQHHNNPKPEKRKCLYEQNIR